MLVGAMPAPDRIDTERLILRRPRARDARAIFARYAADPEVTKDPSWPTHRSPVDTRVFLRFSDTEWSRWGVGPYVIESREGQLLGSTGLSFETRHRAVTGYVLARDAWGQGYATESLQTMIVLAQSLDVRRLYALCYAGHSASAHVLEKCGFVREGILRKYGEFPNMTPGEAYDVACYALVW